MAIHVPTILTLAQAQCAVFVLWSMIQSCASFNLDGRQGSFAKFPSWEPCLNGSFSFDFKTDSPNALLVYLDHGKFKFFELKMVGGSLRLRVNLAEGTVIVRAGEKLNDKQWHTVEVRQDNERTILSVDGSPHSRTAPGKVTDFSEGSSGREIFMYFGGLPKEFDNQLLLLALPSVVFEPRFKGSIRNLFFRDCGGDPHRPEMVDSFGLRSREDDLCERGNPCLNGGVCLTTDDGLICDCAKTDYKGERCDIEKVPSDATFFGAQYFSYNLSSRGDVLDSNQDEVSLDFRTKQADGLLFYTGNKKDYLTISIKDGIIVITINLGSGSYEEMVPKERTPRLDDNRWHHVKVKREAREVDIEVDGIYRESGDSTGRYTLLSSKLLYVAGSPNTSTLPGSRVRTNFKGCMRKVRYKADSVEMDLTEMARSDHPLLKVNGEVIYDKCQELADSRPITFTTPQSYLTIPTWDKSQDKGTLAFQFQTVEQNGLIMYSSGASAANTDVFLLELVDGYLNLVLNQGSELMRLVCRGMPVSDGKPHNVYFEFHNNRGYVTVDGQKEVFVSVTRLDRFDLDGLLFIGGVNKNAAETSSPLSSSSSAAAAGSSSSLSLSPPSSSSSSSSSSPARFGEIAAGLLGEGYVGCLLEMVMNGNKVDLVAAAQLQGVAGVAEYCQAMEPHCLSLPCMHQGVCVEGWNRFTCDCRATGFIDSVCQTAAATLQFDGTQFVKVTQPEESETQTEEISLRFRTMHPNGLLFMTSSLVNSDRMELYLENGVIHLGVDAGSGKKLLSVGHMLNDDRWHTAYIKRRGHDVELKIDVLRPVAEKLPGVETSLSIKAFFIGYPSVVKSLPAEINRRAAQFDFRRVDIGHILQDDNQVNKFDGFIGSMQQFIFNDNHFFEMARTGQIENIQLTARLSSEGYVVADPVTFKSTEAFAVLPRLLAHDTFSVSFQLKTTETDGLLLYNAGKGHDFFAMELTAGFLYYVYNMGGGTQRIRANIIEKLNDNRWHEVRLLRTETYKQLLRVDDNTPTVDDLSGAKSIHFDLQDHLYLGGVKKTMYHTLPKKVEARHGYLGCIGSLDLNGYRPNILRVASPIHEAVGDGCQGPSSQCLNDSCSNGGRCVQQWNTISCDCDMTSYTGAKCRRESITYKFGPGTGLLTFSHPTNNLPSTNRENLALGFRTRMENAVLVRVDSSTFDDFIELELHGGKVYASYNMGTRVYPIGETFEKVNDGKYHVVRFTRSGANSTIQVDDLMMQTKNPRGFSWEIPEPGKQAHTFNNQAYIYIGGKKEKNGTVFQPYQGTMSGLVMNGIRIFELAKKGDERIQLEGHIALNVPGQEQAPKQKGKKDKGKDDVSDMQSTMGIGLHPGRSQPDHESQVRSAVTYHFKLKIHAMNSTSVLKREGKHVKSKEGKPIKIKNRSNQTVTVPETKEQKNQSPDRLHNEDQKKLKLHNFKQQEEQPVILPENKQQDQTVAAAKMKEQNDQTVIVPNLKEQNNQTLTVPNIQKQRNQTPIGLHIEERINQTVIVPKVKKPKNPAHIAPKVQNQTNQDVVLLSIKEHNAAKHLRNPHGPLKGVKHHKLRHRHRRGLATWRRRGLKQNREKRIHGRQSTSAEMNERTWNAHGEMDNNRRRFNGKLRWDFGHKMPEDEKREQNMNHLKHSRRNRFPRRHEDNSEDSDIENEIIKIVDSGETYTHEQPEERLFNVPLHQGRDSQFPIWDEDRLSVREIFSDGSDSEILPEENSHHHNEEVESSSEPSADRYKCSFSGTNGNIVVLDQRKDENKKHGDNRVDNTDYEGDDEDSGKDFDPDWDEGSGTVMEGGDEKEQISHSHFELLNTSSSSARLALLSGSGDDDNIEDDDEQARTKVTTIILPYVIPEGATMSTGLHMTVTAEGKLVKWDHMTTPLNGVTDDIIFSGAGPGCPYEDEEDCTVLGSGTEDDIIKPTVIIRTTPPPPTTTTPRSLDNRRGKKPINKGSDPGSGCTGENCPEPGNLGHQTDFFLSTPEPPVKEEITIKPTGGDIEKTLGSGGKGNGLNIGLIIGITVSVLVAVVILCIALYKFRSRDEGTYRVDESQNFTTLDGKKGQQGNGTLLSHSDTGKRGGKKKDVKEWYV